MEKIVTWTESAKQDLQGIYEFNTVSSGEEKAFVLIERLISKVDILYEIHTGGVKYISDLHPEIDYKKLIEGDYIIIFREVGKQVWINRVFDTRQNPSKLKL